MEVENSFAKVDYLAYLFEDKTCNSCAFSGKGYLLCPKAVYSRHGIRLPEKNTCECWNKTGYAI